MNMYTKTSLIGSIISFIVQIVGWSVNAMGISTMFGVQIPFGLIGLGGSIVFAGFMSRMVWEGRREIQRIQDARPSIEVMPEKKPMLGGERCYLRVHNNGAEGTFRAQVELSSEDPSVHMLPTYQCSWEYSDRGDAKILKGQDDLLRIAKLKSSAPNYQTIVIDILFYEACEDDTRSVSMSSYWVGATINGVPMSKFDYKLRVTISASPELREGIFCKNYILNVDGLKESPSID